MITSRKIDKAYAGQMIAAIIGKNRGMRFCFTWRRYLAAAVLLAAMVPAQMFAAGVRHIGTQTRVRSVVRADSKSGRLVRAYVVSPKPVIAKVVSQTLRDGEALNAATEGTALADLVDSVARKYDVDPLLVHSVIQVESGYNPYAVSNKGAQGLMQLMPGTARRFGVKNSFDTVENLEGGVRYLKYLDSLFPSDIRLTLAAYNAGEGAVWKYRNNIPPYRETEQYVYKVGTRYGKALRAAEKAKAAKPVAQAQAAPAALEPAYARVESFVDANGRLHLRTADRASGQGSNSVSTP
jgi:soluble lytic murein transglycosylase-like protein